MKGLLLFPLLSSLLLGQAVPDESAEQIRQELAANPQSSLAHYKLGLSLMQKRDYSGAAAEFDAALRGDLQPSWVQVEARDLRMRVLALLQDGTDIRGVQRDDVLDDEILQRTDPEYSDEARMAGLEGRVVLSGIVIADGVMPEPKVLQSLGLGLDEKAIEAVQKWRFIPRSQAGQTVASSRTVAVDFSLPEKQSRWHLIGVRFPSLPGTTRPVFESTNYPLGTGISMSAFDEGRILSAIGRPATATLTFDVDEHGAPAHFAVQAASLDLWGNEAIALVQSWRFRPGTYRGSNASVPMTLDFAWGPRDLSPSAIAALRERNTQVLPAGDDQAGPPKVIYSVAPEYPEAARAAALHGVVVLTCIVDEDGTARNIEVAKPLDATLDQKAVEAVGKWWFRAATLRGRPVPALTTVEVTFGPLKRPVRNQ